MAITLNHTIVPAKDKEASARFLADLFGLRYEGSQGHFAPVQVGGITFDFDNRDAFESHHYAFQVSEEEFDQIFERVKAWGIPYGSGPNDRDSDGQINHRRGGRGVYFRDPNGHSLELLTRP